MIYIAVRRDLSIATQIVQATHASYQAGVAFPLDVTPNHVLLAVENHEALINLHIALQSHNIAGTLFHEPDNDIGYTALCSRPIERKNVPAFLKKIPLYPS